MTSKTSVTVAQMVADAKAKIENLTAEEVAAELQGGDVLLVDIREPEELARTGIIAGAVHVPRGMLEFHADPTSAYHREEFDPERRVILHCAGGGRSALAAAALQEMGYSNVAHLNTGINGWIESGLPTETR